MISAEKLHQLGIGTEWSEPLTTAFTAFGINDFKQQAAFIGQCSHESNHFKTLQENLNYRAETLQKLFNHHFRDMDEIQKYAHKPEMIANRIYSKRMGNRDESSGDGWRFHGRGLIQLTGHDNYWHCGQVVQKDLVKEPDLVASPMYAALSAGWFWNTHGCNAIAEKEDWVALTKRINGGTIGLDDRISLTKHALSVLG
jgi:putative chitinase